MNEIQKKYYDETGENWLNFQDEPDIDYVDWLEQKLLDDIKSSEINWKELRSKFFAKCTDKDANGKNLPKVNITPSNLFEWFKNEINKI